MILKVVGLATDINDQVKNWIEGMETAGLRYKLLGVGQKFTCWKMRSKLYIKELEEDPDTDIFIFSDVYDVLVNKSKLKGIDVSESTYASVDKYIIDTFLSFSKPIVISTELGCWPKNCYSFTSNTRSSLHVIKNDYIFPNGGLVIGFCQPLIQLYKHLQNYPDDQYEIGKMVQKFPQKFGLDYSSKLFYTNHARQDRNRLNKALFIHFPGMGFSLLSRLGYNLMSNEQGYTSADYPTRKCTWVAVGMAILVVSIALFIYWIYNGDPETVKNINHLF